MGLEMLMKVRRGNSEKTEMYKGETWEDISKQIKDGGLGECLFAGSDDEPAVVVFRGEICRVPSGMKSLLDESGT